jgi:uncharacterized protein (TIGR00251 family)
MSSAKSKISKTGKGPIKDKAKETINPITIAEPSPMAFIVVVPGGIDLLVRAQPGAKKSGVLGLVGDSIKLGVSAPPEDGKANEALVELIADLLSVRKSCVSLVSGKSARGKRFRILAISAQEALSRFHPYLSEK